MLLGGLDEVGEGCFEGVVGADYVDVYYCFEGVGGEATDWGEEVACCSCSVVTTSVTIFNRPSSPPPWNSWMYTYIQKSKLPNSPTHLSAASCKLLGSLTSTAPIPRTLAPGRAVAMSRAIVSVFLTLRPMMQALPPRCTKARTWAEQIVPAPPVQKRTLFSNRERGVSWVFRCRCGILLRMRCL